MSIKLQSRLVQTHKSFTLDISDLLSSWLNTPFWLKWPFWLFDLNTPFWRDKSKLKENWNLL